MRARLGRAALIWAWGISAAGVAHGKISLEKLKLPKGFSIAVFASGVEGARSLARGEKGTIFVGTRNEGKVYALTDQDGDGKAETVRVIARGLDAPNGVAFRNGSLFVAEISRVLRFDGIESRLAKPGPAVVVTDKLPSDTHHGWKFIAFGPDGKLYVPVGAPCNICEREDPRYAAILRMNADGTQSEVFASGIRNTVGFDWHPTTRELWFTDNGRDLLGDNVPADELNRAAKGGLHFGYPYCHQGDLSDPQFGKKRACKEFTPPERKLGPHVAALGMRFLRHPNFPEKFRGSVIIAEHGSWNRSQPLGYRLMHVPLKDGKAAGYEVFVEGWLEGSSPWGRPVDLLELPDGSLLVSDDKAGAVYRITYKDG